MTIHISNFLNSIIPIQISNADPFPAKGRWVYKDHQVKYEQKSGVFASKKLESVCKVMLHNLKNANIDNINDKDTYEQLEKLKTGINTIVAHYNQKHHKIYRLLSRLFYGDINEIEKSLNQEIDNLKKRIFCSKAIELIREVNSAQDIDNNQVIFSSNLIDDETARHIKEVTKQVKDINKSKLSNQVIIDLAEAIHAIPPGLKIQTLTNIENLLKQTNAIQNAFGSIDPIEAQKNNLLSAINNNDPEAVEFIRRLDTATFDQHKNEFLLIAIDNRNLEMIKLLAKYGANVNALTIAGSTPLMYEISQGNIDLSVVETLLQLGADPNQSSVLPTFGPPTSSQKSKFPPVSIAIAKKNEGLLSLLKKYGADLNCTLGNHTLLTGAIISGNMPMAKALLNLGANPNQVDPLGNAPIFHAISKKNSDFVTLLLDANVNLDVKDPSGHSPMNSAASHGSVDIIMLLISKGADVNRSYMDQTPLSIAISLENIQVAEALLNRGANPNQLDRLGNALIFKAIEKNNTDLVRLLLNAGVNLNVKDKHGNSPMASAVKRNLTCVVKLLAKKDRDLNAVLTYVMNIKPEMMSLLIELGADPNANEIHEEFKLQKSLAHLWNIDGKSHVKIGTEAHHFLLEGISRPTGLKIFIEALENFNKKNHFSGLESISDAFKHAFPLQGITEQQIIERINQNKPIIIMGDNEKHTIGIVIVDGMLMICNRGLGRTANAVEVYKLKPQHVTKELVNNLKKQHPSMDEFNTHIANLQLEKLPGVEKKDQNIGNCGWVSTKTVFLALLYARSLKEPNFNYLEHYRSYTRYARQYYFNKFHPKDHELKLSVKLHKKLRQKVKKNKKEQWLHQEFKHLAAIHAHRSRKFFSRG